ncbi:hypothetical protein [Spirosoma fluminis]
MAFQPLEQQWQEVLCEPVRTAPASNLDWLNALMQRRLKALDYRIDHIKQTILRIEQLQQRAQLNQSFRATATQLLHQYNALLLLYTDQLGKLQKARCFVVERLTQLEIGGAKST